MICIKRQVFPDINAVQTSVSWHHSAHVCPAEYLSGAYTSDYRHISLCSCLYVQTKRYLSNKISHIRPPHPFSPSPQQSGGRLRDKRHFWSHHFTRGVSVPLGLKGDVLDKPPVMKCFIVLSHSQHRAVHKARPPRAFRWQQHATPSCRERRRDTVWGGREKKNKEGQSELIISLIL